MDSLETLFLEANIFCLLFQQQSQRLSMLIYGAFKNSFIYFQLKVVQLFLLHNSTSFVFFSFPKGNKKGPLGRWDFDTQEEYSEYMNNKEALPK